jgi:hypothetical protein
LGMCVISGDTGALTTSLPARGCLVTKEKLGECSS